MIEENSETWYVIDIKTGKVYWYGKSAVIDNKTLDGIMFVAAKEAYPDGAWCCVKGITSVLECVFEYHKLGE